MPRYLLILFGFIFFCSSCNRSYVEWVSLEADPESIEEKDGLLYQECQTEDYTLRLAFVEDAFQYIILHAELESFSKDTLEIQAQDFEWALKRPDITNWRPIIDKGLLVSELEMEQINIKKQKKTRTILNAIVVGLEVASIAAGGGAASVGGAFLYAAESGVYIAEDRQAFKVAELSIEDEIKYVEDWVLEKDKISPYESIDFDILIDRALYRQPLLFKTSVNDETCEFEFNAHVLQN